MKAVFTTLLIFLCNLFIISCNNQKDEKKQPEEKITQNKIQDSIPVSEKITTPYSLPDISPMDMCYFPADYPKLKMAKATTKAPLARVIYSRPHLQGRKLFDGILNYGEPWRLGANESTELDLYSDATIAGKKIKSGRYVLYCIPEKDEWTIVINTNIDSWGLQPDSTKDIAHFTIPSKEINNHLEYLTILFMKTDNGAELIMAWDNTEARLPIQFQ